MGINEKYKGAIFDLDGVIVDTAKYHYLAWKRLAQEMGINFTLEDNEKFKGVSRMACMNMLCEMTPKDYTQEVKIELASKKNGWYLEYIDEMNEEEILGGAYETIKKLKYKGIKIALGSASKNAIRILEKLNICDLFHAIIDGNKVSKAKPDPEVFLLGAKEIGLKPSECVVFEDAYAGIEAGINAQMYTIGIGDPEILSNAHMVIEGVGVMDINTIF